MALPHRGKFITFEGLDGVGKSTQLENLAAGLRRRGIEVIVTREPGGTAVGEKLRAVLLSSRTSGLTPAAELALMFADRAQHVDEQILPALDRGQWVLCDRFTDSSEAYQGNGRELGSALVLQLHKSLCHDLQPDLTILMLSDVAGTVARARRRNVEQSKQMKHDENRFEKEDRAFYERVLAGYLAITKRAPHRVVQVDAKDTVEKVRRKILRIVEERFGLATARTK
ncbi:MAG TPA: dTMP kinase [Candidatus Angelobacter sp.]|nr:dTMP kinase [Candidatus Angelobacter sp.]